MNMQTIITEKCLECDVKLPGRIGQKFCSINCKSTFHYKKSKLKEASIYNRIDNKLKYNRRILKHLNSFGKSKIEKETLVREGFDFNYNTHNWTAKNGKFYNFCYEFGYCELNDGNIMLISWKDNMRNK
jgi:hypothetical protein